MEKFRLDLGPAVRILLVDLTLRQLHHLRYEHEMLCGPGSRKGGSYVDPAAGQIAVHLQAIHSTSLSRFSQWQNERVGLDS